MPSSHPPAEKLRRSGRATYRIAPAGAHAPPPLDLGRIGVIAPDEAARRSGAAAAALAAGATRTQALAAAVGVISFAQAADAWFRAASAAGRPPPDADAKRLARWLVPAWGARPVVEIKPGDLRRALRAVAAAASPATANRVLASARAIFRFAADQGWVVADPSARLRPLPETAS